jgi:hypothetical protein
MELMEATEAHYFFRNGAVLVQHSVLQTIAKQNRPKVENPPAYTKFMSRSDVRAGSEWIVYDFSVGDG